MNIHDITKQIRAFADQLESTQTPAPVDPYASLKDAHTAGKVIQFRFRDSEPFRDIAPDEECGGPSWKYPVEQYRIKPDAPPFQLPPPPPGMQWHRVDGWKEGDLPEGTRPLVLVEDIIGFDECRLVGEKKWAHSVNHGIGMAFNCVYRTTRPLVFSHAWKEWTWHRAGDPMPCDGGRKIEALCHYTYNNHTGTIGHAVAGALCWDKNSAIIGWRYAEPETKEVELGPEDVRCGDELLMAGKRYGILTVTDQSVEYLSASGVHQVTFAWLHKNSVTIRRNGSEAWEKCSKTITIEQP